MRAFQEFLPSEEEVGNLQNYLKNEPFDDLCAAEKYMVAMMRGAKNPKSKITGIVFVMEFQSRFDGILRSVNDMISACDEVKNSILLRKLIAITLTLGNHINTGGEGNVAAGFSLNALVELDNVSAKCFAFMTFIIRLVTVLIFPSFCSIRLSEIGKSI